MGRRSGNEKAPRRITPPMSPRTEAARQKKQKAIFASIPNTVRCNIFQLAFMEDKKVREIAYMLRVKSTTVMEALSYFTHKGRSLSGQGNGRPRLLDNRQAEQVRKWSFEDSRMTLVQLVAKVATSFNIQVSSQTIRRVLDEFHCIITRLEPPDFVVNTFFTLNVREIYARFFVTPKFNFDNVIFLGSFTFSFVVRNTKNRLPASSSVTSISTDDGDNSDVAETSRAATGDVSETIVNPIEEKCRNFLCVYGNSNTGAVAAADNDEDDAPERGLSSVEIFKRNSQDNDTYSAADAIEAAYYANHASDYSVDVVHAVEAVSSILASRATTRSEPASCFESLDSTICSIHASSLFHLVRGEPRNQPVGATPVADAVALANGVPIANVNMIANIIANAQARAEVNGNRNQSNNSINSIGSIARTSANFNSNANLNPIAEAVVGQNVNVNVDANSNQVANAGTNSHAFANANGVPNVDDNAGANVNAGGVVANNEAVVNLPSGVFNTSTSTANFSFNNSDFGRFPGVPFYNNPNIYVSPAGVETNANAQNSDDDVAQPLEMQELVNAIPQEMPTAQQAISAAENLTNGIEQEQNKDATVEKPVDPNAPKYTLSAAVTRKGFLSYRVRSEESSSSTDFVGFVKGVVDQVAVLNAGPVFMIVSESDVENSMAIRDLIDASGNLLLFVPPHSPCLDPLENLFGKWCDAAKDSYPKSRGSILEHFQRCRRLLCFDEYEEVFDRVYASMEKSVMREHFEP